jgi:hypothetical protein
MARKHGRALVLSDQAAMLGLHSQGLLLPANILPSIILESSFPAAVSTVPATVEPSSALRELEAQVAPGCLNGQQSSSLLGCGPVLPAATSLLPTKRLPPKHPRNVVARVCCLLSSHQWPCLPHSVHGCWTAKF